MEVLGEDLRMGNDDAEAQFHVLAVDDSFVDRKLIERLLKNSSYQGINFFSSSLVLVVSKHSSSVFMLSISIQSNNTYYLYIPEKV